MDKIQFRLRNIDADLREAVRDMSSDKLAELARDGLRIMLGIRTTKIVEVTERPIDIVPERQVTPAQTIRSKPAVFVPQRGR